MKATKLRRGVSALVAASAIGLIAASCTAPPPTGGSTDAWEFKSTSVTVNDSQDEVCVIVCVNREDEPYTINIATRVKIGVPGSASGTVVSSRSSAPEGLGAGDSATLTGSQGAPAVFNGVDRLDLLDLADANRKLEVVVIYSWLMEEDTVAVNTAANDVKDVLVDALNSTLATSAIPSDINFLLDIIFSNLGNAFTLLASNIPLLGLGDDALGGAVSVGIAAQGSLAGIIDAAAGTVDTSGVSIPVLTLPPDIDHINIFSMGGTKTWTGQSFTGGGGTHTYSFQANQA